LTALDISATSIKKAKSQLGAESHKVEWIEADITNYCFSGRFDVRHDRAAFHFLTKKEDRKEVNLMTAKRKIEVFSAGCSVCRETIEMVRRNACESCEVKILDMNDTNIADKAKQLSVHSVPAVVIDGKLAGCCAGRGPDEATLKAAGLGQPLT